MSKETEPKIKLTRARSDEEIREECKRAGADPEVVEQTLKLRGMADKATERNLVAGLFLNNVGEALTHYIVSRKTIPRKECLEFLEQLVVVCKLLDKDTAKQEEKANSYVT